MLSLWIWLLYVTNQRLIVTLAHLIGEEERICGDVLQDAVHHVELGEVVGVVHHSVRQSALGKSHASEWALYQLPGTVWITGHCMNYRALYELSGTVSDLVLSEYKKQVVFYHKKRVFYYKKKKTKK